MLITQQWVSQWVCLFFTGSPRTSLALSQNRKTRSEFLYAFLTRSSCVLLSAELGSDTGHGKACLRPYGAKADSGLIRVFNMFGYSSTGKISWGKGKLYVELRKKTRGLVFANTRKNVVATLHENRKKSGYESRKHKENIIGGLPNTQYYTKTAEHQVKSNCCMPPWEKYSRKCCWWCINRLVLNPWKHQTRFYLDAVAFNKSSKALGLQKMETQRRTHS